MKAVGIISRSSELQLSYLLNEFARATEPASHRQSNVARWAYVPIRIVFYFYGDEKKYLIDICCRS